MAGSSKNDQRENNNDSEAEKEEEETTGTVQEQILLKTLQSINRHMKPNHQPRET